MNITQFRLGIIGATLASAVLVLAGCSTPPDQNAAGSGSESNYVPCLVGSTGGFNDKSFNQSAYEGIIGAGDEIGVKPITVESAEESDYSPNVDQLLSQGCNLIVAVGFPLADATLSAAESNPQVNFAIIDDQSIDLPNVKPIVFETSQAAFLAGYAAADYSTSGVVGTFGGMQIPSVTIFMDGFADGVAYYNEQNGAAVRVVGWNKETQSGTFTGGFAAGVEAKAAAQGILDQGADVLLPVGGPIFESAGEAIRDSGKDIALIGVDSDNAQTAPDLADLFLTSILKGVKVGTSDVVVAGSTGDFSNEAFVGTLENGGVGLAPFHSFENKVAPDLQEKLDEITQAIIDGTIVVDSPANP